MTQDSKICVGAITGSYGVRGEARIKSFCADPEAIQTYGPLTTEDGSQSFEIRITRSVKGGYAVRLTGLTQKEQADALKGTRLYVDRDKLPSLPDDEFYHTDLIGLDIYDTGGARLGRLTAIHDHGAGDLLEITGPNFENAILLPFTQKAVPTIDLGAGRIIIDPPEGVIPTS